MRLLDCTLRDGANVVSNGFDAELTDSMLKALTDCGIKDVELGNAKGLGAYERQGATAPLTDREYMEVAAPYVNKARLGMFLQAGLADRDGVAMAAEHGLSFLRVGCNAGDGKKAVAAVEAVKAAGLVCRFSLMKAYVSPPRELAEEAAMLERVGVDAITVMDSAGTMLPDEAGRYVAELRSRVSVPVGFHGHNNLGLSAANALAAIAAGAEEIDCGLLGMARSAGNCCTELLAALLRRMGLESGVDLYGLLEYLDSSLIPAMERHGFRAPVTPIDLMFGLTGTHSSLQPLFEEASREYGVSVYRLIEEVSRVDRRAPGRNLIFGAAERIAGE